MIKNLKKFHFEIGPFALLTTIIILDEHGKAQNIYILSKYIQGATNR